MRFYILFLIGLFTISGYSQPRIPDPKPKLVLFLVLDELNGEQLSIIRQKCGSQGFNKIFSGGSSFQNAAYSSGSGFRGRNSATLFTGSNASTHGIISRSWINRFNNKETDALYGPYSNDRIDSAGKAPSNRLMLASGIADEMHRIHNGKSKVFSIGFHPDILSFSVSSHQDPFFWFNIKNGEMTSNTVLNGSELPQWAGEFNSKKLPDMYLDRVWAPLNDISQYHEWLYFRDLQSAFRTFYYPMKDPKNRYSYQRIAGSPYGNSLIRDFASSLIVNEQIGKDDIPDMLTIEFTTSPSVRKKHLPIDAETEDLLLRLDNEIEGLLKLVDEQVGLHNTLVVCTAINKPANISDTSNQYNKPKGVFSAVKASSLLNLYLMAIHGQGKWVLNQKSGEIYLNNELIAKSKIDRNIILKQACDFLLQVEGIAAAISASDLLTANSVWFTNRSMIQNFHLKRSGDIIFSLEPGWCEEMTDGNLIEHSWGQEYVPLSFYGWRIARQNINQIVSITDVAPTICTFLEVSLPDGNEGNSINGLLP